MVNFDYKQLLQKNINNKEKNVVNELYGSLLNGYINQDTTATNDQFGPRLLNNQEGSSIWEQIKHELLTCENYTFAVAFITDSMVSNLKPIFKDLSRNTVDYTGRVLHNRCPHSVRFETMHRGSRSIPPSFDSKGSFHRREDSR